MTQNHSTTVKRTFKHLSDIERGRLEEMAKSGQYTQKAMAKALGVNQSTISRELKRGKTTQINSQRKHYVTYYADVGARIYKEHRQNCRSKGIETYDATFFSQLTDALKSTKDKPRIHSVDSFTVTYRRKHSNAHVPCTKTVYNLIDRGVIDIRNIDLPMKLRLRPRRKKTSEPHGKNKRVLGRSIEERDPSVLTRDSFGHWELDLVIGKKTKGEPVILTFIERQTRYFITKKLWDKSPGNITQTMIKIIREYGPESFRTITTDNGSEFAELKAVEHTFDHVNVYYAHAYASWEKGSNERHNGLLREFIPKGWSLEMLTYKRLNHCTQAINDRPRRLLDYQSPQELFHQKREFAKTEVS